MRVRSLLSVAFGVYGDSIMEKLDLALESWNVVKIYNTNIREQMDFANGQWPADQLSNHRYDVSAL